MDHCRSVAQLDICWNKRIDSSPTTYSNRAFTGNDDYKKLNSFSREHKFQFVCLRVGVLAGAMGLYYLATASLHSMPESQ
jgi:hypothetical protein